MVPKLRGSSYTQLSHMGVDILASVMISCEELIMMDSLIGMKITMLVEYLHYLFDTGPVTVFQGHGDVYFPTFSPNKVPFVYSLLAAGCIIG